jgi:hypothetical protein
VAAGALAFVPSFDGLGVVALGALLGGEDDHHHHHASPSSALSGALNAAARLGVVVSTAQLEQLIDDEDLEFKEIIANNQDLMRSLQQQLRAESVRDRDHDVKDQAKLLLQSLYEKEFHKFNEWLTDAAEFYNNQLATEVVSLQEKAKADIGEKSTSVDQSRETIALPLLIRSAKRVTKMNFERTQCEISSCEDEVSELEDLVKEAERQLDTLQSTQRFIQGVAKSNEKSEALRMNERVLRETADSSYYKFFSIERLHNWIITGSNDTSIILLFRGPSSETTMLHLTSPLMPKSAAFQDPRIISCPWHAASKRGSIRLSLAF